MNNRKPCPEVIFLDVNEALLDPALLKVSVTQEPGRREGTAGLWSSMMLHHSPVHTLTGKYHGFSEIGVATIQMLAESDGIELGKIDADGTIIPVVRALPPRPDVVEGLKSLKDPAELLGNPSR